MKIRIIWDYKLQKGNHSQLLESDFMTVEEALLFSEDIEKTGRVKRLALEDENGCEYTKKELKKYLASFEDEPTNIHLYFDGGFHKESKRSGIGIVIYYEKNKKRYRIRKNALLDGLISNNEAEYAALWNGLNELENLGVHHCDVQIKGDSLVVINQMSGEWPCYELELQKWGDRIDEKLAKLGLTPHYEAIPRKQNQEADALATQALHKEAIDSHLCLDEK